MIYWHQFLSDMRIFRREPPPVGFKPFDAEKGRQLINNLYGGQLDLRIGETCQMQHDLLNASGFFLTAARKLLPAMEQIQAQIGDRLRAEQCEVNDAIRGLQYLVACDRPNLLQAAEGVFVLCDKVTEAISQLMQYEHRRRRQIEAHERRADRARRLAAEKKAERS